MKDIQNNQNKKLNHVFTKELTSSVRAKLRGLAHPLKPVVQVGNDGFTERVANEISNALNIHELIKVQLPGQTDANSKKEAAEELTAHIPQHAHIVGRIGRIVILFLEKPASEKPKIVLKNLR